MKIFRLQRRHLISFHINHRFRIVRRNCRRNNVRRAFSAPSTRSATPTGLLSRYTRGSKIHRDCCCFPSISRFVEFDLRRRRKLLVRDRIKKISSKFREFYTLSGHTETITESMETASSSYWRVPDIVAELQIDVGTRRMDDGSGQNIHSTVIKLHRGTNLDDEENQVHGVVSSSSVVLISESSGVIHVWNIGRAMQRSGLVATGQRLRNRLGSSYRRIA